VIYYTPPNCSTRPLQRYYADIYLSCLIIEDITREDNSMQLKFCQRKKIIDFYFGECKARAKAHGLIIPDQRPLANFLQGAPSQHIIKWMSLVKRY